MRASRQDAQSGLDLGRARTSSPVFVLRRCEPGRSKFRRDPGVGNSAGRRRVDERRCRRDPGRKGPNWSARKALPSMPDSASGTISGRSKQPLAPISSARQWSGCHVRFSRNGPEHGGMIIHCRPDATLLQTLGACGNRHRRELQPRSKTDARDPGIDLHRPGLGSGAPRRCWFGRCAAWPSDVRPRMRNWEKRHPCEDQERCQPPATSRRGSSRSPTFHAPSRARSPSSRCADIVHGRTVKNKEGALANPGGARPLRRPAAAAGMMFGKVNGWSSANLPRFEVW